MRVPIRVGGQQVGSELNARESGLNCLADGLDQQGLGQPRHALQQYVPIGQQADQGPLHQPVLADDDLANLSVQHLDEPCLLFHQVVYLTKSC